MPPHLTPLEKQAMMVKETEYGNIGDGDTTWVFAWMDEIGISNTRLRGVMASLEKKGLVSINKYDGEEAEIHYTEEGLIVCAMLNNGTYEGD